jgi:hypothetical protein
MIIYDLTQITASISLQLFSSEVFCLLSRPATP